MDDGSLEINGTVVTVDGTAAADQLTTSENLLSSTGTDSGGAMGRARCITSIGTMAQVVTQPDDARAQPAPSAHRGSMYLGTSGNAATWRFVGIVRTNGSTNFVDSTTQRFVRSYYNQPETYLINVFTADRTRNGTPFDEINSEIRCEMVLFDDEITATINGSITLGPPFPEELSCYRDQFHDHGIRSRYRLHR